MHDPVLVQTSPEPQAVPVAALEGAHMQLRQSLAEVAREKPEILAGMIGRWIEEDHA